jgi:hypothetical protein
MASRRSRPTPGSAWNINILNVLYINIWENEKQKQMIYIQNNSRRNTGSNEVLRLRMRLAVYFMRHNIQGSTDVGAVPQPGKTPIRQTFCQPTSVPPTAPLEPIYSHVPSISNTRNTVCNHQCISQANYCPPHYFT